MKTLFLTNSYLHGNSGGIFATAAFINAFASISESLTVVYSMKEGMEPEHINNDIVKLIPIWDKRSKPRKYLDLCFGIVNRFQKHLFKYINPTDYDTVVFNNSDVSSCLIKKFKQLGLRTITIHHNYQIEYLRGDTRLLTRIPNLFWTLIYEGQAVRNSNLNLTLTCEDIHLLTKHYGQSLFEQIGIFEYSPFTNKTYPNTPRKNRYVITGWLGSKQTDDSLIPWIKNYYPILKEEDPLTELTIAGKDPSPNLCSIAKSQGIRIIASPKDMQPILDNADYYICPTDRGGGLKLRILDGLKSGLPVLTHKVSARGYEYMQSIGLVKQYDNIDSFREGIRSLISLKKNKNEITQLYRDFYSLAAGTKRLENILKSLK